MKEKGAFWPELHQELLLKSAFLEKDRALASWNQWKQIANINDLDAGSYRLMPQVYFNLKDHAITDPNMDRMKGIYRYNWAKNQNQFKTLEPLFQAFRDAGIPMLLLKGAALSLVYYQDFGLRPMDDIDLLIPESRVFEVIEIFQKKGWRPNCFSFQMVKKFNATFMRVYPAICFENQDRISCDVHWKVLYCDSKRKQGLEEDLWDRAQSLQWNGLTLFVPSCTDQLFHVCIHGAIYNKIPTFRWIGDAMMILKKPCGIDWGRLLELAQKHSLILTIQETLEYLKEVLDAPIPSEFINTLKKVPVSEEQISEYFKRGAPVDLSSLKNKWLKHFSFFWGWHQELSKPQGGNLYKCLTFPRFMQKLWGYDSLFSIPLSILALHFRFWRKHVSFRNS